VTRCLALLVVAGAVAAGVILTPANGGAYDSRARAAAKHVIGVRVQDGSGEFYDRRSGQRFVPRGMNYVRLSGGHSTFNVGSYQPRRAETALARMQALGYNTVRVFVAGECPAGCVGDGRGGISRRYVRNLVDFLRRAERHRIFVLLTTGFLPQSYATRIHDAPLVDSVNLIILAPSGIAAYQAFWADVVRELRRQQAPLATILGYDVFNELSFSVDEAPFSLTSGSLRAPNGRSYDLADAAAKERLMSDGIVTFVGRVRSAIKKVDPSALVTASFFQPHVPNRNRDGDARDLRTAAVVSSSALDFVDLHPYPGLELTLAQYMQNFGVAGPTRKPLLMGELGAFRDSYASAKEAASALEAWQAGSCAYGFDGWLVWTWDTDEQPELWNGRSEGGEVAETLSPKRRRDPCSAPAGPQNLALGKATTASGVALEPPANAVDGNPGSIWNSGGSPPQWIEIDLGMPATVARIRLRVAQSPAGRTTHLVSTRGPGAGDAYVVRGQLSGSTSDSQVLEITGGAPWANVRFVRVETLESPSWVSWREIEVLGSS
jgi:hypothetical protein